MISPNRDPCGRPPVRMRRPVRPHIGAAVRQWSQVAQLRSDLFSHPSAISFMRPSWHLATIARLSICKFKPLAVADEASPRLWAPSFFFDHRVNH